MNWASICENPVLANLPYKIQTDKWGNIVMSPATTSMASTRQKSLPC